VTARGQLSRSGTTVNRSGPASDIEELVTEMVANLLFVARDDGDVLRWRGRQSIIAE
jgi:hypothetical protein